MNSLSNNPTVPKNVNYNCEIGDVSSRISDINSNVSEISTILAETGLENSATSTTKFIYESEYEFLRDESYDSNSNSENSFDLNEFDFRNINLREITHNILHGNTAQKLEALEIISNLPTEEVTLHISWSHITWLLGDIMGRSDSEHEAHILCLKVYNKMLNSNESPRLVVDGFVSLVKSVTNQIQMFASRRYDERNTNTDTMNKYDMIDDNRIHLPNYQTEILMKSIWLLIKIQNSMPEKWIRFNVKKLHVIISSFVELLDVAVKNDEFKLLPLMLVALLDPTASWSKHWLHGATGRLQYCSALKKYNKVFKNIVEVIVKGIYQKKMTTVQESNKHKEERDENLKIDGQTMELLTKKENHTIVTIKPILLRDSQGLKKKFTTPKYLHTPRNNKQEPKKTDSQFDYVLTSTTYKVYERNKTGLSPKTEELPKIMIHSAPSTVFSNKVSPKTNQERKCFSPTQPIASTLQEKKLRNIEIIPNVSNDILEQALFMHCVSMITYLTEYRGGRALFPLHISSRKRHLTLYDTVSSIINYIQKFEENTKSRNEKVSNHFSKLMIILHRVEKNIVMLRKDPTTASCWI